MINTSTFKLKDPLQQFLGWMDSVIAETGMAPQVCFMSKADLAEFYKIYSCLLNSTSNCKYTSIYGVRIFHDD